MDSPLPETGAAPAAPSLASPASSAGKVPLRARLAARGAWREELGASWQTGKAQSRALAKWLWHFVNAPGPNDRPAAAVPPGALAAAGGSAAGAEKADWLRELLLPLRPAYKQALLMAFFINLIGLGTSVFTLQVYDRVITHGGMSSLAALVLGMAIAIAIDHTLRGGRAALLQRLGLRIEAEIARRAFARMLGLPALILEARPPAYWQAVFRDIEVVRSTCSGATALLLIDLPFLVLSLIFIGLIAWPLLPVAVLSILVFVLLAWRAGQMTRDGAASEREKLVGRDANIAELAGARITLKALAADGAARSRWERNYAGWMEEALARSREVDHYRDVAHGMTVANTVVTTAFGALAIIGQMLTMGALIAANILAGRMIAPLVQLVTHWRSFGQFQAARKRLDALFDAPQDRQTTAIKLPRPQGTLTLDKASFRYPGTEHDQIQPLAGQLGPYGLHAIVGANGSGKTTLLKLLRGLYRCNTGRVLIDGADIAQFAQADLAAWIGYLPQQVQLISGSVRDNIVLSDPAASDEAIVAAARLSHAHDFVVDLPDGYDTEVGDAGGRFSGGEKKRIAIAQVLLRNPPILLLDEPTSDLDRETELAFCQTLRELAVDHTVVVVTHSPALLAHCNGILVLDRGRLAAAGPAGDILPQLGFGPAKPRKVSNVAAA